MGGYVRRSGVRERIEQLFLLFPDLKVSAHRHASKLSGGQRTMLALARGLMIDPAVLILDEPSAGLSPTVPEADLGADRADPVDQRRSSHRRAEHTRDPSPCPMGLCPGPGSEPAGRNGTRSTGE